MFEQAELERFRRCRLFARAASLIAIGVGTSVLVGWQLDVPALKSVIPGAATMKPFTAVAFLLSGLALQLWIVAATVPLPASSGRRTGLVRACAGGVILIGALTLIEYLAGVDLGFDTLLFSHAVMASGDIPAGRMALATAFGFVVLGMALFCLDEGARSPWRPEQPLGVIVLLLGVTVVQGYIFGVAAFYRILSINGVSLHTALLFLLMGGGVLVARPDRGITSVITLQASGGAIARRLLPIVIALPLFGGWLRWQGELAGWYGTALGLALFVSLNVVTLTSVVWWSARELNRLDALRIAGAREREAEEARLSAIVSSAMDAIISVDEHQQVMIFNPAAERMFGCTAGEAVGGSLDRFIPERFRTAHSNHLRAFGNTQVTRRRMGELGAIYGLRSTGDEFPIEASISQVEVARKQIYTVILRDISERKQSEEFIARLAAIVECSDDAIIGKSLTGIIESWNPGAHRLFGYAASEVIGRPMLILFPPDRVTEEADILDHIARGELVTNLETVRVRKDGTRLAVSATVSPIKDAAGRVVGASTIARDITARRNAEATLRQQASLLDLAPVLVRDLEDRILFWSQGLAQLYGYTREEAVGRSSHELLSTEFPVPPEEIRAEFRRKGLWEGELVHRRRDGSRITVTSQWLLHSDEAGLPNRILEVNSDVTNLRSIEAELRTSQSQLVAALEAGGMGLLDIDLAADHVRMDVAATKLWGFARDRAFDGRWQSLLAMIHPDDRKAMTARIKGPVAANESADVEFRVQRPDGSTRWFASKGKVERDETGFPVRRTGLILDVTERKHAEKERLRSQKLESLGTLAGGVAHDFNNILLAIAGNTKLALEDLPTDHPTRDCLVEIAKASARATDLVQRILAFSRPQEYEKKPIQLGPVVEEALQLVRATIPAMIEIKATLAEVPPVAADPAQIHQIVVNLATNASHAMGSRSGRIEARLDAVDLGPEVADTILNLRAGRYVRLEVGDNGTGMDRATLERIFDPFFTTKAPGVGTGLGLSVVHSIVKGHDGAIHVYSEPGKGTTFRLYFPPIAGEATVEPAAFPTGEAAHTGSGHILYVDDESSLIYLVTRMLKRLGYTVTGHTDPVAALKDFSERPGDFAAVVTDLSMPKLTGFDLAREILVTRPDTPIILMSGYVRQEDEEMAREVGIRELLLKPDTVEELGRALDRALGPLA